MQKLLIIGLKDLTLVVRDRAALILMLLAPFALTVGLGVVTGRLVGGGNRSGISKIPVAIVNQDGRQLGNLLVDLFASPDLAALVAPTVLDDVVKARQRVEEDRVAAAVILPAGFTDSALGRQQNLVQIEVHANPGRVLTASVVQAIVEEFLSRVRAGVVSGQVTVTQLISSGRAAPEDAERLAREINVQPAVAPGAITVKRATGTAKAPEFDLLTVLAPNMALMFLIYTVSNGARSLLAERADGTLPRLLATPTTATQILGGKVFGIFLTGALQVGLLITATTLLFGVHWGDTRGVAALVLASAVGATGWGLLMAATVQTPAQVGSIGSAVMLIFAILGGGFGFSFPLPAWAQPIAHLTPNRWGMDGFITLGAGGTLAEVTANITALVVMGTTLFAVAVWLFRRRGVLPR